MNRRVTRRVCVCGVLFAVLLGLPPRAAFAQTTVVLDAPASESIDTVIRGGTYASANYDGDPLVTRASGDASYVRRILLKFNTETAIPKGASIQSARLTLTVKGGNTETRRLGAYRLATSFDDRMATWKIRKSGYAWRAAGGDLASKYAEASVSGTPGSKVTLDITALVQEIVDAKYEVSRWTRVAVMDVGASSSGSFREYYPSETTDASRRPTLTVVYGGTTGATSSSTIASSTMSSSTSALAPLPSGWSTRDIGAPGATGSAGTSGSSFVITGAGLDIWGSQDHFRFVYRSLSGDGSIVAQVATIENVEPWTKAGVMMRESLRSGSKQAFMLVTPGKGLAFQRRASTDGLSTHTSGGSGTAPRWVRLTRQGSTITAARSVDGVTWTTVGSQKMAMAATIYVGLAVSSHETGVLATASFDGVRVKASTTTTTTAPPPTSTTSSSTLRVLHWNTHHGGRRTDGVYDPNTLVNWIVKMNPQVASLNEVDNSTQAAQLHRLLESKTGVDWKYHYDRGNMLITRLPVNDTDVCVVNTSVGRKATFMNILVNGRPVSIYSAHLSLTKSERLVEVPNLQSCARSKVEARILAGDYNMQAGSSEYLKAMEKHTDAWKVAKSLGTAINYPGNCDGCTRNSRIDYVFTSSGATGLAVRSAQIYDTRNSSGVAASDHKPMVVVYAVK